MWFFSFCIYLKNVIRKDLQTDIGEKHALKKVKIAINHQMK